MPNKDRRTKAELLVEITALGAKNRQLEDLIRRQDEVMNKRTAAHKEAVADLQKDLFSARIQSSERQKLLKLQALGGIRVASFLEGKVEGVMTALKTVLNNTKTDDGDFPPELGKILEEMARDLADVDDDFDEEDEIGVD